MFNILIHSATLNGLMQTQSSFRCVDFYNDAFKTRLYYHGYNL